jgi:hypothetical protein
MQLPVPCVPCTTRAFGSSGMSGVSVVVLSVTPARMAALRYCVALPTERCLPSTFQRLLLKGCPAAVLIPFSDGDGAAGALRFLRARQDRVCHGEKRMFARLLAHWLALSAAWVRRLSLGGKTRVVPCCSLRCLLCILFCRFCALPLVSTDRDGRAGAVRQCHSEEGRCGAGRVRCVSAELD